MAILAAFGIVSGLLGFVLAAPGVAVPTGLAFMIAGLALLVLARIDQARSQHDALMERLTLISAQFAPAAKLSPPPSFKPPPVVRTPDPPPPDTAFVRTADMPPHLRGRSK